jgi:hypothetical protein
VRELRLDPQSVREYEKQRENPQEASSRASTRSREKQTAERAAMEQLTVRG